MSIERIDTKIVNSRLQIKRKHYSVQTQASAQNVVEKDGVQNDEPILKIIS